MIDRIRTRWEKRAERWGARTSAAFHAALLLAHTTLGSKNESIMNDFLWAVGFAAAAGVMFKIGLPKLGTIAALLAMLGFVLSIGNALGFRI
jgi:hypothetical protein